MTITPSHIVQYLYCPRFTYFEYVLRVPQYAERHYKVRQGQNLHLRKTKENKAYLRKRMGTKAKYIDQYLANELLRGVVDEIIEMGDGTLAPLDYKFSEYKGRVFDTYKAQIHCYAWLIMVNFQKTVTRGFLVYTRSYDHVEEIPVTVAGIDKVKKHASAIFRIIGGNRYPKATKDKQKCLSCTYRNICTK